MIVDIFVNLKSNTMLYNFSKILSMFRYGIVLLILNVISLVSWAQPTHVPRSKPEPVNFFESTENIIFYVVLPVVIVILYMLWRRNINKQKKKPDNKD